MFVGSENLDDNVDIKRAWKSIRENIKISNKGSLGYYELKPHKLLFYEGCSISSDRSRLN
jgi:hypothetical protein